MKNKGFTLVELLAVIVILAIIALIAVPTILHIIEESKIKSLEISTSEYIRAVNISLMNKGINENVSDGLYTITDDGKKIVLGDKEIDIEYEGKGLKSGQLLIEDSKVVIVLKGFIDDYYARVNGDDITILKSLNENDLAGGTSFNEKIKKLVGNQNTDGTAVSSKTIDKKVKRIEFLQDGVLPEGYTKEKLEGLPNIDLSKAGNGSIKGYYNEETGAIYVYSDGYISCLSGDSMFYNFQSVEEIEFNLIDTSKITVMSKMFSGCNNLKTLNLTGFDTSKVVNMNSTFSSCSSLTTLDLSSFDTSKVTSMSSMFYGCSKLTTLDLSNFDTSKVIGMSSMFMYCSNLKEIKGIEKFNTSNVTNMYYMFGGSDFETIDLSSFDTSKVTSMQNMFTGCYKLKHIKFGENFDTSQVTNMSNMFSNCRSLTTINLSNFNTQNVTNIRDMFNGCSALKNINFGENFDTSKVNDMTHMFNMCNVLEELDLTMFDTHSVTSFDDMFSSCFNLKTIKVTTEKWNLSNTLLSVTKAQDYTYIQ